MTPVQQEAFTIQQTGEILGVSADVVRRLIAVGRVKAIDIGVGGKRRHLRITRQAIDDFLNRGRPTSRAPLKKMSRKKPPMKEWF